MKNSKRVQNPLRRRILRELRGDWRKYLVVGLFLILTIGFVSGMYVANESMMAAAQEGIGKYKLEDGHFELADKADETLLAAMAAGEPVDIYENFFQNVDEDYDNDGIADGTVRVYARTEEVNLACVLEGRLPEAGDELAMDRMHADNVGVAVGDEITAGGSRYRVVGLLAYVNYSTLHEKASDLIFDALQFDVAMVTEEGFERLHNTVHYGYAWRYAEEPADEIEEKALSDDLLAALLTQSIMHENKLEDFLPRYANPAINFAKEDMGSDEAMGGVLLDILIVIIAFIFAVTIRNTIEKEAQTIGTLRASGYTRGGAGAALSLYAGDRYAAVGGDRQPAGLHGVQIRGGLHVL